jgi:hypothetical protein
MSLESRQVTASPTSPHATRNRTKVNRSFSDAEGELGALAPASVVTVEQDYLKRNFSSRPRLRLVIIVIIQVVFEEEGV